VASSAWRGWGALRRGLTNDNNPPSGRAQLDGTAPDWPTLGWFVLAAVLAFLAGHAWFYKLGKSFADLI